MKREQGVTLVALVISIIVVVILAGIGIGTMTGVKDNINTSKDMAAKQNLSTIQQVVLETYIKYAQNGTERVLRGVKISYTDAKYVETKFKKIDSNISLKQTTYNLETADPGITYYKLNQLHLKEMGIEKVEDNAEYVVNYSTGEVFDNINVKTAKGEALYVYAK